MSDNPTAPLTQSLVAEIVSSYVRRTRLRQPTFRSSSTRSTNRWWERGTLLTRATETSAVPNPQSVRPQYIVCLTAVARKDVAAAYTGRARPDNLKQYRARWKLSPDYPLTALLIQSGDQPCEGVGIGPRGKGRRPRGRSNRQPEQL